MWEVRDGKVVSDRYIAGPCNRTPEGILLGHKSLMTRWVAAYYKHPDSASKAFSPAELQEIGECMDELIKNQFRILGVHEDHLRIGLAVYPAGATPITNKLQKDDIEKIEGIPISKKGIEALSKLIGSDVKDWIKEMIISIQLRDIPF